MELSRQAGTHSNSFLDSDTWQKKLYFRTRSTFYLNGLMETLSIGAIDGCLNMFSLIEPEVGQGMVWDGISWRSKMPLVFVNVTLNAEEYVNMVKDKFLPWVVGTYFYEHILQQDCSPLKP